MNQLSNHKPPQLPPEKKPEAPKAQTHRLVLCSICGGPKHGRMKQCSNCEAQAHAACTQYKAFTCKNCSS